MITARITVMVVLVGLAACSRPAPRVVLWVWERPEDLSAVDPRTTSLAVLSKSLVLRGAEVLARPRMQPLESPPAIVTISVVRIDAEPGFIPQPERVTKEIAKALYPHSRELQIDFDARNSERAFYRNVIQRVRAGLPREVRLTMTALASWCMDDAWIRDLPVDDAVPMLFEMGPDSQHVLEHLGRGRDFSLALCRHSVGLSLSEPVYRVPRGRTMYFFSREGWGRHALDAVNNARVTP